MKIRRHHSDTTRNLHAALKALTEADALILDASAQQDDADLRDLRA